MDSLDHVCETSMPIVDPEQTITWKDGATEWRELQERHTQICMITWKNSVEHQNSLIIIGINGKRIFYTFFYIYFYNLKWPSKSEIIL